MLTTNLFANGPASRWPSRELSKRVHAGQSRIVQLGFRHGAPVAYGFRRELVDPNRKAKTILQKGEHKALITDRVRIALGEAEEIAVVRWIFEQCLKLRSDSEIARELNRKKVPSSTGRPWTRVMVSTMLQNENYIGNLVYNRTSRKLGAPAVDNSPALWVRGESGVQPVVSTDVFQKVQKRIEDRRIQIPEGEMLSRLRRVLHKKGRLTAGIINNTPGLPGIHTYIHHFGSVRNVYRLIGYTCERDHSFIDAAQAWAQVTAKLTRDVSDQLERAGRRVVIGETSEDICIDQKTRVLFRIARAFPEANRLTQWRVPRVCRPRAARWIVVVRLTDDNDRVLDYVLIPAQPVVKRYTGGYLRFTDMARDRLGFESMICANELAHRIGSGKKSE